MSRKFASIAGAMLLAIGFVSLIPGLEGSTAGLPALKITASYGAFLRILPMNILNKIVLIFMGLSGIYCASLEDPDYSIIYSRAVFGVSAVLALLGFFNATKTLGGYWPLFGGEAYAHAVLALGGAYFGFMADKIRHKKRFSKR